MGRRKLNKCKQRLPIASSTGMGKRKKNDVYNCGLYFTKSEMAHFVAEPQVYEYSVENSCYFISDFLPVA
jgi:hypothetical protein